MLAAIGRIQFSCFSYGRKSFKLCSKTRNHLLLSCRMRAQLIETQAKESKLWWQSSGLLDRGSAIDILSINFVKLLLLVSDCCSASILSQLRNSVDCKPLTLSQVWASTKPLGSWRSAFDRKRNISVSNLSTIFISNVGQDIWSEKSSRFDGSLLLLQEKIGNVKLMDHSTPH